MSETQTEPETTPDAPDTENPPVDDDPDQDEGAEDAATTGADAEPNEDDAEASAAAEREQELAAERQAEEQSLEAQQAEQDKLAKQLNQVAKHTVKRYKDILGDDLGGWVGCPMCADGLPGIRLPVMPPQENMPAIKAAIGEDPDPPLKDDPYSRQCDSCGGFGVTKTNSHVTGQTSATCLDCKGRGWIAVGSERDTYASGAQNGSPIVESPVAEGFPPPPLITETPRTPAEEELRAMGAIVVWPPKPPDPATLIGG